MAHFTMHLLGFFSFLLILTCVNLVPVKEPDEALEGMVFPDTFGNGNSGKSSKVRWHIQKRRFLRFSNTTASTVAQSTDVPEPSVSTTDGTDSWTSITQSAGTAVSAAESTETASKGTDILALIALPRSTFSPFKVHYDDYNYPSLNP